MIEATPPPASTSLRKLVLAAAAAAIVVILLLARTGASVSEDTRSRLSLICFDAGVQHLIGIGQSINPTQRVDIDQCGTWAMQLSLTHGAAAEGCLIEGDVQEKQALERACLAGQGIDVPIFLEPVE